MDNLYHSFNINFACEYGIECSLLIGQIFYWCKKNEQKRKNFFEGRYWMYHSVKGFAEKFPYFNERQIRYYLEKLKKEELILMGNFNKGNLDKTGWYTLTEKGLSKLQNCQIDVTNLSHRSDKIVTHKNININNIRNIRESKERENLKPTLEEVKNFAKEQNATSIAEKFYKYYDSNLWLDKDNGPINWKQKFLTWVNTEDKFSILSFENRSNTSFKNRIYEINYLNKNFQNIDDLEI